MHLHGEIIPTRRRLAGNPPNPGQRRDQVNVVAWSLATLESQIESLR
jgi:hypothetical protein